MTGAFSESLHIPSRYVTLQQRHINVGATSLIDVDETLYKHHVPAGLLSWLYLWFSCVLALDLHCALWFVSSVFLNIFVSA